ncbi:hypothetical protein GGU10DRAFT_375939 [Lentinula aff. detonsa]|uniref:Retrovirus-related Pol polyprotein from transposon TNT 1-94-like beta-barrel domain-containing protein n=2 Tax=Lentinula TaxID=5352 RepID=A0AA38KPJ2_9AGAR|nr:hypothetical protein GGU10DRAFT_375939 [Lentinula aff. detonsa]
MANAMTLPEVGQLTQHYGLTVASTEGDEGEIYADTGASDHFFRNWGDFVTYTLCLRQARSSKASTHIRIEGWGKVSKIFEGTDGNVVLTFENALHSPDVSYNLVSISKMDRLGYQVLFGSGVARFYSPGGKHFLTGYRSHGLYQLHEKGVTKR